MSKSDDAVRQIEKEVYLPLFRELYETGSSPELYSLLQKDGSGWLLFDVLLAIKQEY